MSPGFGQDTVKKRNSSPNGSEIRTGDKEKKEK
jgi:hypothetical protein